MSTYSVETTWDLMEARLRANPDAQDNLINNVRLAFCAGVYAAAAQVLAEGGKAQNLSEAADRLERR